MLVIRGSGLFLGMSQCSITALDPSMIWDVVFKQSHPLSHLQQSEIVDRLGCIPFLPPFFVGGIYGVS